MRKSLVLMFVVLAFIACDFATDSVELKPDIEITYMNPLGWITYPTDTITFGYIEETKFVTRNSVDAYLQRFIFEYYDVNGNTAYISEPLGLYAKIEGRRDTANVDTFILENVPLPVDTVRAWCETNNVNSVRVHLHYIYSDEYFGGEDTCTAWWGIYYYR